MPAKKIEKNHWGKYFDDFTKRFSKDGSPELTKVEVLSGAMGVQMESTQGRLLGLTYDRKEDALEVEFPSFVHRIFHPKEILVEEEKEGFPSSLKVVVDRLNIKTHKGLEEILTISHPRPGPLS